MVIYRDIMLDLETMDNSASAAIVSIGAVACDLVSGEITSTYYRVVDLEGQADLGLTIGTQTLYWWMQQSDGARYALTVPDKLLLTTMLKSFNKWLSSIAHPEVLRLWGNGASFDNAIIRHAFKRANIDFDIAFWNDRDMRTIVGFYPPQLQAEWRRKNMRKGTHHNALDDAKYQVKYCSNILQELGVKELY